MGKTANEYLVFPIEKDRIIGSLEKLMQISWDSAHYSKGGVGHLKISGDC